MSAAICGAIPFYFYCDMYICIHVSDITLEKNLLLKLHSLTLRRQAKAEAVSQFELSPGSSSLIYETMVLF